MNSYYILKKDNSPPIVIEDSFSWWCFFFGIFWALYKGVWKLAGIFFALFILIFVINYHNFVNNFYLQIFQLFCSFSLAFYANDMLKKQVLRSGYKFVTIITAPNHSLATQRFLDQNINNLY